MAQQSDEKNKGSLKPKIKFSREADHQEPQQGKYENILKSVVVTVLILGALAGLLTQINMPKSRSAGLSKKKLSKADKERIRKFNRYSSVGYFHEGYARAERNGKFGFVDENGNEIIPPKYEWVGQFNEGVVRVFNSGKAGYIEKQGKVIIPEKYDDAWEFSEGVAKVMLTKTIDEKLVAKYGYVNKEGAEIIAAEYDDAQSFHEGLAAVRKGEKWGYINMSGSIVIPFDFDHANSFIDGFAMVSFEENNPFFIDKQGNKYDNIKGYQEGVAAVKKEGKWGFVNKKGKLIIGYRYNEVRSFNKGEAQVRIGQKRFYINKEGRRLK